MKCYLFSVRDSKAGAFLPPFTAVSRGVAERMFTAACLEPQHDFYRYSADYALYEVGEFDQENGVVIPVHLGQPELLVTANAVLARVTRPAPLEPGGLAAVEGEGRE